MPNVRFIVVGDIYSEASYINMAEMIDQVRNETPGRCLFLLSGDLLGGSAMCEATKGAHIIEILNAMRADCASIGNHEFDFTESNLTTRVAESQFVWLSANTRVDGAPLANVRDSTTFTVDGLKVGVFGVITGDTPHVSDRLRCACTRSLRLA